MEKHVYQDDFFDYVNNTSLRSAKAFLSTVNLPFEVDSILDVGCGKGAWLSQWQQGHAKEIFGVDGDYVNVDSLLISKEQFLAVDLRKSFDLNKKFSVVECLEVAEHIDENCADILIQSIVNHGDVVIFSAAQKGQGGEFHVNEQPINYWVKKFNHHDYVCFDYVRPQIKDELKIEPWYRFNMVIFIHKDKLSTLNLPEDFLSTQRSADYDFTQLMDKKWLLRNKMLSYLPYSTINMLSKAKQHILPMLKSS